MKFKIGKYYRYYGTEEVMKLVELDEFNRTLRFKINKELLCVPFALTGFLVETEW